MLSIEHHLSNRPRRGRRAYRRHHSLGGVLIRIQAKLGEDQAGSEWQDELNRRTEELDKGQVELVDGDEFLRRLRAI